MMTSSMETFPVTGPLWEESNGHRWIPLKRPVTRSLRFSFINAWTNGWANNRDAGDLRRHLTPDGKVHGANMGPTWVLSAPDGPHVGPMNFAIRDFTVMVGVLFNPRMGLPSLKISFLWCQCSHCCSCPIGPPLHPVCCQDGGDVRSDPLPRQSAPWKHVLAE